MPWKKKQTLPWDCAVIPWHQNWTANVDKIPHPTNCIKSGKNWHISVPGTVTLVKFNVWKPKLFEKQPGFQCCTLKAANWLRPFGFNWPGPTDQFKWCLCQTLSENGTYIVTIIFCVRTPYFWIWYMVWSYNLLTSVASCALGPKPPTHVEPTFAQVRKCQQNNSPSVCKRQV